MLVNFIIWIVVMCNLCSVTKGALTTAQLEKKINGKIKLLQEHYDHDIEQCEKHYQELKTQSSKTTTAFMKDMKMLAAYVQEQQLEINGLKDQLKKEDEKIESVISGEIPIGFIYTELPFQYPPSKLWPHFNWRDITSEYAGLFFRAEGGGSARFGEAQSANQSWISNVHSTSYYYDSWKGIHGTGTYTFPLDGGGKWSMNVNPSAGLIRNLNLFTTSGENRPRNTAVKIWARVG